MIVDSYGQLATNDKVQEVLVPDVVEKDDYKKWWETARREMKKDGHFKLPTRKTEPIEYQSQDIPLQERLLGDFKSARGLKARLPLAVEIAKSAGDLDDTNAAAEATLGKLNEEIASHARTQSALALEAVMVRDELAKALGAEVAADASGTAAIWETAPKLSELLTSMPVPRQRRALESYQASDENWAEAMMDLINHVPARLVGESVSLLCEGGHQQTLADNLAHQINHHTASGELLLWLAKDKGGDFQHPQAGNIRRHAFGHRARNITRETRQQAARLYPDRCGHSRDPHRRRGPRGGGGHHPRHPDVHLF